MDELFTIHIHERVYNTVVNSTQNRASVSRILKQHKKIGDRVREALFAI